MTSSATPSLIQNLSALKAHYEHQQAQVGANIDHYAEMIAHTNALLLGLLVQRNGHATLSATPEPAIIVAPAPNAVVQSKSKAKVSPTKTKPETITTPPSRISFSLLPAYQGKTKLEAIGTVLKENQGSVIHQDSIIQELYGDLNPGNLKVERLRMKAALLQGVKKKLWQKAPVKSSYILERSTQSNIQPQAAPQTAPTEKTSGRGPAKGKRLAAKENGIPSGRKAKGPAAAKPEASLPKKPEIIRLQSKTLGAKIILPMHSDFDGLSKIDAVAKVMNEKPGTVLNVDDIIERLFGQLSLADYKSEKARMKDVMSRGLRGGLWRKANAPLSFIAGETKVSGRKSPTKPKTRAKTAKA